MVSQDAIKDQIREADGALWSIYQNEHTYRKPRNREQEAYWWRRVDALESLLTPEALLHD